MSSRHAHSTSCGYAYAYAYAYGHVYGYACVLLNVYHGSTYYVPDVEQALKHPYMASFYTGKEPKCPGVLTVPIDDDHK